MLGCAYACTNRVSTFDVLCIPRTNKKGYSYAMVVHQCTLEHEYFLHLKIDARVRLLTVAGVAALLAVLAIFVVDVVSYHMCR